MLVLKEKSCYLTMVNGDKRCCSRILKWIMYGAHLLGCHKRKGAEKSKWESIYLMV